MTTDETKDGIICASAGNHAQGVALSCNLLKIKGTIYMPAPTPNQKIEQVKMFGKAYVEVVLVGDTFDDSFHKAMEECKKYGKPLVHPFNDSKVIEGQGTVGLEIVQQSKVPIDYVFIPVGGGGLVAGIAAYTKANNADIKIIGVEPDEAPCMHQAFESGKRIELERIGIFADGAAVKQAGEENYRIAKELVDEILLVSVDEICAAVKDIFEDTRSIPEPAGALALAGLKQYDAEQKIKDKEEEARDLIGLHLKANWRRK